MKRGFDEFYGTVANTPFFNPPNFVDSRVSAEVHKVNDPNFYTTDAYAERAVDWLEKHKDEPFFLYLPFNAQHAPLQAHAEVSRSLQAHPGRETPHVRRHDVGQGRRGGPRAGQGARDGPGGEHADLLPGRQRRADAQTTSKNDPLHGFKSTTCEGGVRVPFMVQWKGKIPAGKTYDHPGDSARHPADGHRRGRGRRDRSGWKLDGVNLLPYLTGKKTGKPHETLYWRFGEQWAIRHGDWKLVVSRVDGPEPRLFNLAADIGESKDLIQRAQPDKAKELKALWDKWNEGNIEPKWRPRQGAAAQRRARQAR